MVTRAVAPGADDALGGAEIEDRELEDEAEADDALGGAEIRPRERADTGDRDDKPTSRATSPADDDAGDTDTPAKTEAVSDDPSTDNEKKLDQLQSFATSRAQEIADREFERDNDFDRVQDLISALPSREGPPSEAGDLAGDTPLPKAPGTRQLFQDRLDDALGTGREQDVLNELGTLLGSQEAAKELNQALIAEAIRLGLDPDEFRASIGKAAGAVGKQIRAGKRVRIKDIAKLAAEASKADKDIDAKTVLLPSGERVDKEAFDALTAEQQTVLRATGITGFDQFNAAVLAAFKKTHVELSTGEFVTRADFDNLSGLDQAALMAEGTEAFNATALATIDSTAAPKDISTKEFAAIEAAEIGPQDTGGGGETDLGPGISVPGLPSRPKLDIPPDFTAPPDPQVPPGVPPRAKPESQAEKAERLGIVGTTARGENVFSAEAIELAFEREKGLTDEALKRAAILAPQIEAILRSRGFDPSPEEVLLAAEGFELAQLDPKDVLREFPEALEPGTFTGDVIRTILSLGHIPVRTNDRDMRDLRLQYDSLKKEAGVEFDRAFAQAVKDGDKIAETRDEFIARAVPFTESNYVDAVLIATPTAKALLKEMSLNSVPIYGTVRTFSDSPGWARAVSIATDIAFFAPFVGFTAGFVRGGTSITSAIGKTSLATLRGPIQVFIAPVKAASKVRSVRQAFEAIKQSELDEIADQVRLGATREDAIRGRGFTDEAIKEAGSFAEALDIDSALKAGITAKQLKDAGSVAEALRQTATVGNTVRTGVAEFGTGLKRAGQGIIDPIEQIADPRRIPISSTEISTITLRMAPSSTVKGEALAGTKAASDEAVFSLMRGGEGIALDGETLIRITKTPANNILGPAAFHATPDIRFVLGKDFTAMGDEGGMFLAPSAHTRFVGASAYGLTGGEGAMPGIILIRDPNVLATLQGSNKLFKGKVELEAIIPNDVVVPGASQVLRMRGLDGGIIHVAVIGKPLTLAEIAKMKVMGTQATITHMFKKPLTFAKASDEDKVNAAYNAMSNASLSVEALALRIKNLNTKALIAKQSDNADEAAEFASQARNLDIDLRAARIEADRAAARYGALVAPSVAWSPGAMYFGEQDISRAFNALDDARGALQGPSIDAARFRLLEGAEVPSTRPVRADSDAREVTAAQAEQKEIRPPDDLEVLPAGVRPRTSAVTEPTRPPAVGRADMPRLISAVRPIPDVRIVGAPRKDVLKAEAPRTDAPRASDAPRSDTPRADTPRVEIPRITALVRVDPARTVPDRPGTPRVSTPRTDAPRTDPPRVSTPRTDAPRVPTQTTETKKKPPKPSGSGPAPVRQAPKSTGVHPRVQGWKQGGGVKGTRTKKGKKSGGAIFAYVDRQTGDEFFSSRPIFGIVPSLAGITPTKSHRVISRSKNRNPVREVTIGVTTAIVSDSGIRFKGGKRGRRFKRGSARKRRR